MIAENVRLVPLDAELGVVAALQHDLRRAEVDRLAAALDNLVDAAHPALVRLRRPVEGAEPARGDADVGVVDVAIDQVRRDVFGAGEAAAADGIRGRPELVERRVLVEVERLGGVDTPAGGSVVQTSARLTRRSYGGIALKCRAQADRKRFTERRGRSSG